MLDTGLGGTEWRGNGGKCAKRWETGVEWGAVTASTHAPSLSLPLPLLPLPLPPEKRAKAGVSMLANSVRVNHFKVYSAGMEDT